MDGWMDGWMVRILWHFKHANRARSSLKVQKKLKRYLRLEAVEKFWRMTSKSTQFISICSTVNKEITRYTYWRIFNHPTRGKSGSSMWITRPDKVDQVKKRWCHVTYKAGKSIITGWAGVLQSNGQARTSNDVAICLTTTSHNSMLQQTEAA